MAANLRYLLFQIRNANDSMRDHEVNCFALHLGCDPDNIAVHDLLSGPPSQARLGEFDAVLIGGSGDYSVVKGGDWLAGALDAMRHLYSQSIPTFASCWGFQALARALGGLVVNDLDRAELGSLEIQLTEAGQADPLFGPLGSPFIAQIGHEDIVDRIPADALLLASTDRVTNEAFTFPGKLIYATQFHPELQKEDLLLRMQAYPQYVQKITGMKYDEFVKYCREAPKTGSLLKRFAQRLAESKAEIPGSSLSDRPGL